MPNTRRRLIARWIAAGSAPNRVFDQRRVRGRHAMTMIASAAHRRTDPAARNGLPWPTQASRANSQIRIRRRRPWRQHLLKKPRSGSTGMRVPAAAAPQAAPAIFRQRATRKQLDEQNHRNQHQLNLSDRNRSPGRSVDAGQGKIE
jgi:hypothetical protein